MPSIITEKSAELRRKRRAEIVTMYKRNYCMPFCKALIQNDYDTIQKLCLRCSDFKRGVAMADPNGKWYKRFADAYHEVEQELKALGWEG